MKSNVLKILMIVAIGISLTGCFNDDSSDSGGNTPVVKNQSWVTLATSGISDGTATYQSLAVDSNGAVYVAYSDASIDSGSTVVKEFTDDNGWVNRGTIAKTNPNTIQIWQSLIIKDKTLYIASAEASEVSPATNPVSYHTYGKINVAKYNDNNSWVNVANISQIGSYLSLVADNNKNLFMAFQNNNGVKTAAIGFYSLTQAWYTLADPASGESYWQNIAVDDNDNLYIAYQAGSSGYVKQYNSEIPSWDPLGDVISTGGSNYQEMAISPVDNSLYVAYRDLLSNLPTASTVKVKHYVNGDWVDIGDIGLEATDDIKYPQIKIATDGVPYIAFIDDAQSTKRVTVMKFNGTGWEYLVSSDQNPIFSSGNAASAVATNFLSLALDSNNTPYIAFQDLTNAGKTTVMKFAEEHK